VDDESRKRLIRDLMLAPPLSSSASLTAVSPIFLLVWSVRPGSAVPSELCDVVLFGVLPWRSLLGGRGFSSGVFSLVFAFGLLQCSDRPIDSNLDVRSAESGRLPPQRGTEAGVSALVGLTGKMADTGRGLDLLGWGRSGTDTSG